MIIHDYVIVIFRKRWQILDDVWSVDEACVDPLSHIVRHKLEFCKHFVNHRQLSKFDFVGFWHEDIYLNSHIRMECLIYSITCTYVYKNIQTTTQLKYPSKSL